MYQHNSASVVSNECGKTNLPSTPTPIFFSSPFRGSGGGPPPNTALSVCTNVAATAHPLNFAALPETPPATLFTIAASRRFTSDAANPSLATITSRTRCNRACSVGERDDSHSGDDNDSDVVGSFDVPHASSI